MYIRMFLCCKQKTAYEMRISDWSSDVCSSDLRHERGAMLVDRALLRAEILEHNQARYDEDVHAHCPGHSPAAVLAMPFRARKEAGIHHPYLDRQRYV